MATHEKFVPAHPHDVSDDGVHIAEIDEIAAVAAAEAHSREPLFKGFQRIPRAEFSPVRRMEHEVMALHFDITDGGGRDDFDFLTGIDDDAHVRPAAVIDPVHALFEDLRKIKIAHGLDEIGDRLYLVPLHCILRHIRDEDDTAVAPHAAETLRKLHPVEEGHFDVEENNVVLSVEGFDEFHAVRKGVEGKFIRTAFARRAQIVLHDGKIPLIVIDERDSDQPFHRSNPAN